MDLVDIAEQVRDALADTLGLSPLDISDSASASTLSQWDSLHHVMLIVGLEDRFNVTYTSEEIPRMSNIEVIAHITAAHLGVPLAS